MWIPAHVVAVTEAENLHSLIPCILLILCSSPVIIFPILPLWALLFVLCFFPVEGLIPIVQSHWQTAGCAVICLLLKPTSLSSANNRMSIFFICVCDFFSQLLLGEIYSCVNVQQRLPGSGKTSLP